MHLSLNQILLLLILASGSLVTTGCGPRSVKGGTQGILIVNDEAWPDLQLTVHQWEENSGEIIGFAVTKGDGSFELLLNGAEGPLWLTPGDYRFTLETVGPPMKIPKIFTQPETTPLKINWTGADPRLEFHVQLNPQPKKSR